MTLQELFQSIADAIRKKDGTTEKITPYNFPARIDAIPTGGGSGKEKELIDRSITSFEDTEITWIGKHAFRDCKELASVNLPSVTSVDMYAFSGCESLEIVNAPLAYTVTGYAFENCTALKQIELPNNRILASYSMKKAGFKKAILGGSNIGAYAFQDCTSLETVDIKGPGWNIGANAFNGCSNLTTIILRDWTGSWNVPRESAFMGTPILNGGGYFYVPQNMISYLMADAGWTPMWGSLLRAIEDWPEITG